MRPVLTPILALSLFGLAALPAVADPLPLNTLGPDAIAGLIDATSFPNSIGPRRQEGLRSFADYGFTEVDLVDGGVKLYEDDRSWMFGISVLGASENTALLCVRDKALGGPTYDTQSAIAFARGEDGMLVATEEDVASEGCTPRP